MIIELPVRSDLPAYSFKHNLDGTVYTMSFRFNERMPAWIMDISTEQDEPIVLGIPIYTNTDFLGRFITPGLPPGQFLCIDESGEKRDPDRDTFGGEVKLFYADAEEFE